MRFVLEVDQFVEIVFFREALGQFVLVLVKATAQIVRNADIHEPVIPITEQVNVITTFDHSVNAQEEKKDFSRSFEMTMMDPRLAFGPRMK